MPTLGFSRQDHCPIKLLEEYGVAFHSEGFDNGSLMALGGR